VVESAGGGSGVWDVLGGEEGREGGREGKRDSSEKDTAIAYNYEE
jgi:hypothetical protein